MCIIIAKDKIGRLPTESELKNSYYYNNDGAGFMYVDNGKVVIDKGYMTYDSFIKHYRSLLKKYNNFDNKSLVIHCRIGTSGKNVKGNTHPYPISDKPKLLRTKHLTNENVGIAHNGIIKGYGTATGLNDTQEYISKYLYQLYFHYRDFYKDKDMLYQIEMATNSKFAILDKTDTIYYVGDFVEDKGLNFSNTTYKNDYSYYSYDYKDYDYKYYEDRYYNNYDWDKTLSLKEKNYDRYYKDEDEVHEEDYLLQLHEDWYIDLYANGNIERVGSRQLYFDYETLELWEWIDNRYELIMENPIIFDEDKKELFL